MNIFRRKHKRHQKTYTPCLTDGQTFLSFLQAFRPYGGGALQDANSTELNNLGLELSLKGAQGFLSSLNQLTSLLEPGGKPSIREIDCTAPMTPLGEIFIKHGSDKSYPSHRYDLVYESIFGEMGTQYPAKILEIGLGSNNPDTVSHMGESGTPGASLFSYRDYFPNALIYGADIDTRILFESDRIKTAFVDQLDSSSFNGMHEALGRPELDIFIEDGLHSVTASLNSLNYALAHVRRGGFIILEDLVNPDNIWNSVVFMIQHFIKPISIELVDSGGLMLVIHY